jgi:hypothetical protein
MCSGTECSNIVRNRKRCLNPSHLSTLFLMSARFTAHCACFTQETHHFNASVFSPCFFYLSSGISRAKVRSVTVRTAPHSVLMFSCHMSAKQTSENAGPVGSFLMSFCIFACFCACYNWATNECGGYMSKPPNYHSAHLLNYFSVSHAHTR